MPASPSLIERHPSIAGGQPIFRGTRIPLRTVLASLADGDSLESILRSFPTLTPAHLQAAISFAAAAAQEDLPLPPLVTPPTTPSSPR